MRKRYCSNCKYIDVVINKSPCLGCLYTIRKPNWVGVYDMPKEQQEKNEPYPVTLIEAGL